MKIMNPFRLTLGLIMVIVLMSGYAGLAMAAESAQGQKAADWKFHDIVDVTFVKKFAVMPHPKDVLIVDVRPKQPKYDNGYIPTAINIPLSKFDEMTDQLPKNKNDLLIFYCEGPT